MTSLDAPIVGVTVYPGNARIVRRGALQLSPGRHRYELTRLPSSLDAESVRVSGTGAATILAVDVGVTRNARHDGADEAGRLQLDLRTLDDRLAEIADSRTVLNAQREALTVLSSRAGHTLAKAVVGEGVAPEQLDRVVDYVTARLDTALSGIRELAGSERELLDERARVERSLADLSGVDEDSTTIAIEVEAGAGEGELEVSYLVPGASWTSRYDLHLDGDRLRLDWFGLVSQTSGETWPAGQLRLSTARPGAAVAVPELSTWYLRERPPAPPVPVAAAPRARGVAMVAMDLAAPAPMARVVAEAEHGLVATDYVVERPGPVPPDGGEHQVVIGSFDLAAEVDRVTAPVRGTDVVIRVVATNSTEHTMRPGRAALFHGPEFVGATQLASWAPGEERELALGLDDRVRVERTLVHRQAGKALVGGTRRYELGYRTEVTNHGPVATEVTVLDQLPVSASAEISVKDVRITPTPASAPGDGGHQGGEDGRLGLVRWRVPLQPGASVELALSFRVDVAKGTDLVGWRD